MSDEFANIDADHGDWLKKDSPKYPDVEVPLSYQDGNAFFIISRVSVALREAGVPAREIDLFRDEAMSGDYDNVLQTCMKWVSTT